MSLASRFNRSAFGRFLNSPAGRVFRLVGGSAFVALGVLLALNGALVPAVASLLWGALAISAGGLDVCYFSLVLGGPFTGQACRADAAGGGLKCNPHRNSGRG
ncbi:MAG: hypothetical protein U0838_00805 [Chloroflexota bacterium]